MVANKSMGFRPWIQHAAASRLVAMLQNSISQAIQSNRSKTFRTPDLPTSNPRSKKSRQRIASKLGSARLVIDARIGNNRMIRFFDFVTFDFFVRLALGPCYARTIRFFELIPLVAFRVSTTSRT